MPNDDVSRRRVLSGGAATLGTIALAGCLTGRSGDGDPTTAGDGSTDGTAETDATGTDGDSSETTTANGPRDVTFEAPHGTTIEATAYGSGSCGVVLVPQINMDRGSWEPQATTIAEMGHLALAIDEDPDDRAASVRGAIRYLRGERNVSTVVLVGASTGGEAVVVANATTDRTVDGTITLSAAGGADRASNLQGRSLFVVSEGDEDRFVRIARRLHRGAPKPKALIEFDGSAHGQRLFDSKHGDELRERMRSFLPDVCSGSATHE